MSSTDRRDGAGGANGSARELAATASRVWLVRHAQASWGSADYDVLSPLGHAQARHLGEWLAGNDAAHVQVVRGSLLRHAQTLDAIKDAFAQAGRSLPEERVDPDWNEFDHVPVLRAYAATQPDDPDVVAVRGGDHGALRRLLLRALQGWRDGHFDDVAGESWPAFGARVAAARDRIDGGFALVVTSGGAIWRCAQAALDLDDAGLVDAKLSFLRNTSISTFDRGSGRWRMLSWDTVPHFAAAEQEPLHTTY
jgi:broad specificity phosphatase PhoE